LEGQAVRAADLIAYLAADLADAVEAGLLAPSDVPPSLSLRLGSTSSSRVSAMTIDLLENSTVRGDELLMTFSPAMTEAMDELRAFLLKRVYRRPELMTEMNEGRRIVERLYEAIMTDDDLYETLPARRLAESRSQAACDFIAGMTDKFAADFDRRLRSRSRSFSPNLS
jgi:dGTPase